MIFDTHAHYDDEAFDSDREELLSGLVSHGIGTVVDIGADMASSKRAVELALKYDFIYAAVGVHPSEVSGMTEQDIDTLRTWATGVKIVAIGEIGLDYHWGKTDEERINQDKWFRRQIALAKEVGLPIVIHSRDAAADTMSIIKEEKAYECGGIVHCYSYSPEMAREYVEMGFYLGIGGVVTYKNSKKLKETVAQTDLKHLVLETDCPYLSPEPHRGKRNDSRNLKFVVQEIAQLKGISEEEIIRATEENARRVYGIDR